jgi:hypothetical protein
MKGKGVGVASRMANTIDSVDRTLHSKCLLIESELKCGAVNLWLSCRIGI